MKFALASDLDGTLIHNNTISEYNKTSLDNLKSNGGLFIISTGRPYNGVVNLVNDYDLDADYKVLLNGSLVLDKAGEKVLHKSIPFDAVRNVVNYVLPSNPQIALETGFTSYIFGGEKVTMHRKNKDTIDNLDEIKDYKICLISLWFIDTSIDILDDICSSINTMFKDTCIAYRNVNHIDVVPLGCSKGEGIKLICEKENIDVDSLYTIGDSFNDVSMFDITKNSFTFHHCEDSLKKNATNLVHSVSECIDSYILK